MSNVSDRDKTGTVMLGASAENEIRDIHAEPGEPNQMLGEVSFTAQVGNTQTFAAFTLEG